MQLAIALAIFVFATVVCVVGWNTLFTSNRKTRTFSGLLYLFFGCVLFAVALRNLLSVIPFTV